LVLAEASEEIVVEYDADAECDGGPPLHFS
jgi:hypothetical protein